MDAASDQNVRWRGHVAEQRSRSSRLVLKQQRQGHKLGIGTGNAPCSAHCAAWADAASLRSPALSAFQHTTASTSKIGGMGRTTLVTDHFERGYAKLIRFWPSIEGCAAYDPPCDAA
jgi:hypothetical protein